MEDLLNDSYVPSEVSAALRSPRVAREILREGIDRRFLSRYCSNDRSRSRDIAIAFNPGMKGLVDTSHEGFTFIKIDPQDVIKQCGK